MGTGAERPHLAKKPTYAIFSGMHTIMKKLIVLAVMSVFATIAYCADFADVSITEVKTAIANKNAIILDVNGTESWRAGHVPGAIDYIANKDNLAKLLPADKNALIIAYCGNPHCKAYLSAAGAAQALGYTNIKHMSAGIDGWKQAKETVEKAN